MTCEYCNQFIRGETCAGCGAPNPYLRGDVIHLRAGIDPYYQGYMSTSSYRDTGAGFSTAAYPISAMPNWFSLPLRGDE